MSKLKIRVHESKVSRIRNQDEFEKWLDACWNDSDKTPWFADMGSSTQSELGPNGEPMSVTIHVPYYIEDEAKYGNDDSKIMSRLNSIRDEVEKVYLALPGVKGLSEYLKYVVDVDGDNYAVNLWVIPTDAFWDLDLEDAKYTYTKANKIFYDAVMGKYGTDYWNKKF